MTFFDHFKGIFGLSGGFWMLFAVYKMFSVSRFIVNRYEHETDLLDTIYFKEHFTFTRYMYNLKSASMYSAHLILCTWGWGYFGKKKIFRDIKDPKQITRHFSAKEIKRVKRCMIYGMIVFLHGIAYCVFRYIWPEVFS
jgi:hypothetical protein